jgi:anion-transporting  ArsA/GET3 family ATPase
MTFEGELLKLNIFKREIVLFGGKGGTGKTEVDCPSGHCWADSKGKGYFG